MCVSIIHWSLFNESASSKPMISRIPYAHPSEPPIWGRQRGLTPICSDFPVFFGFALLVFWKTPICSTFFRFVPMCYQSKIRANQGNPFLPPLSQIPECFGCIQQGTHVTSRFLEEFCKVLYSVRRVLRSVMQGLLVLRMGP